MTRLERSVRSDLRKMGVSLDAGLSQIALGLVHALDEQPGARDTASLSRELRATLAEARGAAAPAREEVDPLDELARRRDRPATA